MKRQGCHPIKSSVNEVIKQKYWSM